MKRDSDIAARKSDHVALVLGGLANSQAQTGFDAVRFEHMALPELALDDVDVTCTFLGHVLGAPLLISSMTGGYAKGAKINYCLAEAAERQNVAFAVGSQRIAIEREANLGFDRRIRDLAPHALIMANFGGAQLRLGYGVEQARRAIDLIEANALIIHLNPLQEAVQPGGDRDWSGILAAISALAGKLDCPLIVKEVGFGISGRIARQLFECGVEAVDVAGAGGTNWAMVESKRACCAADREVAEAFASWGIPTATAIQQVRAACPGRSIIGSGGVRDGVDVAKAIRLGADIVGMAGHLLTAATDSADAVCEALEIAIRQLRITCFCTGSNSLTRLREAPIIA